MKKTLLSLSLIFVLNQNATAMIVEDPTLIANQLTDNIKSYAQMVQDYAQQVNMYKQMLIDTLNFEKHLEALGINMSEWQEIIGQISDTISGIENLASDLQSIPDDFKNQFARTTKACDFLNSNVDGFSSVSGEMKSFKKKTSKCFQALQNSDIINEKINALQKDLNKATNIDEINSIKNEIANIQNAANFVKQEKNKEMSQKILAAQDAFFGSEDEEKEFKITAYQDRAKQLESFAKQMKEAKNQKQTTAITNSILLAMLEQQTQMQGIMLNYSSSLATQQNSNSATNNTIAQTDYENEVESYEFDPSIYANVKKMQTDDYGLPVFSIE